MISQNNPNTGGNKTGITHKEIITCFSVNLPYKYDNGIAINIIQGGIPKTSVAMNGV